VAELTYRRVLFVAPDDKSLQVIPELDALEDLDYQPRVLQGQVTDERLYDAARSGRYDVIHFACHGDPACLVLSGGIRLNANGVLQVARQAGAKIVFINACDSARIGQKLVNAGIPVAIATLDEVEDSIAKQTAAAFYTMLAQSNDVHAAYLAACGGDTMYSFHADGGYEAIVTGPLMARLATIDTAIRDSQADRSAMHRDMQMFGRWMMLQAGGTLLALILALILIVMHVPR
jgi:hypothetical protein